MVVPNSHALHAAGLIFFQFLLRRLLHPSDRRIVLDRNGEDSGLSSNLLISSRFHMRGRDKIEATLKNRFSI